MNANEEHPIIDPCASQRASVRRGIAQFQERLQAAGHDFRDPPPEPTSCCGCGCNGCVWESYDAALMFWYEDAGALLTGQAATQTETINTASTLSTSVGCPSDGVQSPIKCV